MAVIRPEKAAKVAEIKELLTASKCTILVLSLIHISEPTRP